MGSNTESTTTYAEAIPPQHVAGPGDPAEAATEPGKFKEALRNLREDVSKRIAESRLFKLLDRRDQVRKTLRNIPNRMQKVTNQASLVLELLDDFSSGHYREVPWHTVAIATCALLYSVSPADVVPDALPIIGAMDDMVIITTAMRLIRRDLRAYIEFKGYDPKDYF